MAGLKTASSRLPGRFVRSHTGSAKRFIALDVRESRGTRVARGRCDEEGSSTSAAGGESRRERNNSRESRLPARSALFPTSENARCVFAGVPD